MATKAQLRADAKERQNIALTAEVDRLDKEKQLWGRYAERATSYTVALTDPRALILIQPDGFGHWAVFLHSPDLGGSWTGDGWGPLNADYTDLYRWELFEALAIADRVVADDAAEVERWRASRQPAGEQATPIHDHLSAVASC